MAFSIHDLFWVPLTGGVSSGVLPAEPQNFYTPSPLFLNFAHRVCKTLCMYAGSPLMKFGVVGGRGVLHPGFKKGYGRRKRRDFLPPNRRKRRDFFLGFCGWLAGVDRTLRALSFLALRCYSVCGFPLSPASLI